MTKLQIIRNFAAIRFRVKCIRTDDGKLLEGAK